MSVYKDYLIDGEKKASLVSFMRKELPDSTDTLSDPEVYKLAQDYFIEDENGNLYEYEDWDASEYDYDYTNDVDSVNTSPSALNSLQHKRDTLENYSQYIPQAKFQRAMEKHYQENPEAISEIRKASSLVTPEGRITGEDKLSLPFSDAWFEDLSEFALGDIIMPLLPEHRQKALKQTINERTAGLNYRIRHGDDKYSFDEEESILMTGPKKHSTWEPGIADNIMNQILATGASDIAGYIGAGKIMQIVNPQIGSTLLKAAINSQVGKWILSRTPNFINKTIPNSKAGLWLKEGMFKNFDKFKAADQAFTVGQINGMLHTHYAALESVANQTSNRGKYVDNNGTINHWDLAIDITKGYAEGVAVGSIVGIQNNLFDSALKHSSILMKKGDKLKGRALYGLTNPVSKYASHGITYTTMPLIWDEERRAQYISKDGSINFGKYFADVTVMGGYSLTLVGASQALGNYGNVSGRMKMPDFKVKLNANEIKILKTKWKESQMASAGKGQKDISFEGWIRSLNQGELANLMRGKSPIKVPLMEKLKSFIGIRPTMPWDRHSKIFSQPLPAKFSLPEALRKIRNDVKNDIAYESNKKTNVNLQTNEQKLLLNSRNNVASDLKGKVPYEFFEKTVGDMSESVDMGNGLKSIYDIANESLRIIDKITIKNENGESIGVDNSLATNEEMFFLQAYAPSVIPAYQGYRDTYLMTDDGKEAYIKRYESEKGVTLNKKQRKLLVEVAKNQNEAIDELRDYLNRKKFDGDSENEQTNVKNKNNKPDLTPKKLKVILLDENGVPSTNEVLSIDASEATKLIDLGRAMKVSFAKNKNIPTNVIDNNSAGKGDIGALEDAVIIPKLDTNIKQGQFKSWIKELDAEVDPVTYKTISVGNNVLQTRIEGMVNNKGNREIPSRVIEGINDVIDIKVISQLPDAMLQKMKEHNINRLLLHAKKDSFSEITTDDIVNYFDSRVAKKQAAGEMPALGDGERSSFFNFFKELEKKGAVLENPYNKLDKRIKNFTTDYNDMRPKYKKENATLFDFFKNVNVLKDIASKIQKISKIKKLSTDNIKDLKQISKDTKIPLKVLKEDKGRIATVLELFYKTPVRDQEINVIRPDLVIQNPEDGTWYIDLTEPRRLGGARKSRGTPRPLPITKSLAEKILLHGKEFGMDKKIFSKHSDYITKLLAHTLGKGSTAKQFKAQLKTIAQGQGGLLEDAPFITSEGIELFINEKELYGVIAGHKTGPADQISKYYTEKQNYADFFAMAKQVMDKVNSRVDEMMKPITPVVAEPKQQLGVAGKIAKKVLKTPKKFGQQIEDVSGKSDKEVVKIVSDNDQRVIPKDLEKRYRKSVIKEFDRQTVGMDKLNKEDHLAYYAKNAGIEGFEDFNLKEASVQDLMDFSREILIGSPKTLDEKKMKRRQLDLLDKARDLADRIDLSKEERNDIIRLKFRKNNILALDEGELKSYIAELRLSQDVIDRGIWKGKEINPDTFSNLVAKIPGYKIWHKTSSAAFPLGGAPQFKYVMYWLEDKHGIKGCKDIADNTLNHVVWEQKIQGYLTDFESNAYLILADKKLRLGGRQKVARRNAGKKEFEKIKKHLWWLQEDQWFGLKKFVESNKDLLKQPEYKEIAKIYNNAKKFMDGIYDKKGVMRIDTPESRIAKAWHRMTERIKKSYLDGFKANMTEAQFDTFMAKHGPKWIEKTFYMTKSLNKEFVEKVNMEDEAFLKEVDKQTKTIAVDRAFEKHGKDATLKQIEDEKPAAFQEALNTFLKMKKYSPQKASARYLLDRKLNLPPVMIVEGKPMIVWNTSYDAIANKGIAGQAKVSATIRWLPYYADLKGLPTQFRNVPKMLVELGRSTSNRRVKAVADYITGMIESRVGIGGMRLGWTADVAINRVVAPISHFLNKNFLSFYLSAIKNAGLGSTMNNNIWGDHFKELAVSMKRALDFEARQDAKGKGLIALSLSAIETKHGVPKLSEWLFEKGKFQSSEEWTRLVASMMSLVEAPMIVDALRMGSSHPRYEYLMKKGREIYDLTDEDFYLLKTYGLSGIEAAKYPVLNLDTKRFKEVDKSNAVVTFEGKVLTKPYDIAQEAAKVDFLHQKLITMAHINSQGATAEIFQLPIFQHPFASGAFQFQKMAFNANKNLGKLIRINRISGNWYRSAWPLLKLAGRHTGGSYTTGRILIGLMAALRIAVDDRELDDKRWKSFLKTLIKGEIGQAGTPLLKFLKGEVPKATDFMTIVPYVEGHKIAAQIFDILKYQLSKVRDRKGSSATEKWLIPQKKSKQTFIEGMIGFNSMIRNVVTSFTNIYHPYNLLQKKLKGWETTFLQTTTYSKADIKTAGNMSPYNQWFIKSFNESDNYKEMALRLNEKYMAHFVTYKSVGKTDAEAHKEAWEQCMATIKNLCPLSIGQSPDGRVLNISRDDEFQLFLIQRAITKKEKDPLVFWKELNNGIKEWKTKTDSLLSNYQWIIRNDLTIKNDRDSLFSKKLYAPNLEQLGFKLDENGNLVLNSEVKKYMKETKDLK